ncbi:MAG: hypothetical protein ACRD0A_08255 [Acidimicrobiales bacterium]
MIDAWPPGSVEALEFTMRMLRRDSIRTALEAHLTSDVDYRLKNPTRQVLEVYEPEWPGGVIYADRDDDDEG